MYLQLKLPASSEREPSERICKNRLGSGTSNRAGGSSHGGKPSLSMQWGALRPFWFRCTSTRKGELLRNAMHLALPNRDLPQFPDVLLARCSSLHGSSARSFPRSFTRRNGRSISEARNHACLSRAYCSNLPSVQPRTR